MSYVPGQVVTPIVATVFGGVGFMRGWNTGNVALMMTSIIIWAVVGFHLLIASMLCRRLDDLQLQVKYSAEARTGRRRVAYRIDGDTFVQTPDGWALRIDALRFHPDGPVLIQLNESEPVSYRVVSWDGDGYPIVLPEPA